MKIEVKNGIVTATAETEKDIKDLFRFQVHIGRPLKVAPMTAAEQKERSPRARRCKICDNVYKSVQGLGIHMSFTHGIKSPITIAKETIQRQKALQIKSGVDAMVR